jgi:signal transduction histidine kinase
MVETAESGDETLRLLDELREDEYQVAVVVADYIMPGMRGDELLRQIRHQCPHTVNIMLSGQADLDAVGKSIQYADLYRFIAKPWHPDDLRLTIDEALQSFEQSLMIAQRNQERQELIETITAMNANLELQVQERTAQINQNLQELHELNQLKDDFLHTVSHDLRTPLTGMLLVLQKLYGKAHDPIPVDRQILAQMLAGCEHQLKMLNTILEAHGNEIRGLSLERQPISLRDLVQAIVQNLGTWLAAEEATVMPEIAADLPLALIDEMQIRRVIENLITNAVKHNPRGVNIWIRASQLGQMLVCQVQDNGVGMDAVACEAMFERYRQGGTRAQQSRGVGLGLYISRQIILAHNGLIQASSQPNQGLCIEFTLPIVPD